MIINKKELLLVIKISKPFKIIQLKQYMKRILIKMISIHFVKNLLVCNTIPFKFLSAL